MSRTTMESSYRYGEQQNSIRSIMADTTPTNLRVTYHNEATINTGNFQNVKPGFTLSADVPAGASPTEVAQKLERTVEAWLDATVQRYREELDS